MDYSKFLSKEQKKSIIEQRLAQFASEAYQHEINKSVAEIHKDQDALKYAVDSLATLKIAIELHVKELDALG